MYDQISDLISMETGQKTSKQEILLCENGNFVAKLVRNAFPSHLHYLRLRGILRMLIIFIVVCGLNHYGISPDPSAATTPQSKSCNEEACSQHSQHSCEHAQNGLYDCMERVFVWTCYIRVPLYPKRLCTLLAS